MKSYMLFYSILLKPCTSIQPLSKLSRRSSFGTATDMWVGSIASPSTEPSSGGPNLCINCKHFKKDFFTKNKFGKCSYFVKENEIDDYFVTGIKHNNTDYYYCSVARKYDHLCGEEGKFFMPK